MMPRKRRDDLGVCKGAFTAEELTEHDGRVRLKRAIIEALNEILKEKQHGMVMDVYFDDFIVQ